MKLAGPLATEQERQLETVRGSARHLLSLINDLLDLAKIESGKVELNFERVDCHALVNEVATTLRPLAESKGLSFEVDLPDGDVTVPTDRRALSQILINLTNNAIKFTDKGSVKLLVRKKGANGSVVTELSVLDTGMGIKKEDQAKLFEAFEQVHGGGKRQYEGTGLGLHLSQKLAGILGGRIEFESQYGKGSRFTMIVNG
jgi:protein-histidine pros-kinase